MASPAATPSGSTAPGRLRQRARKRSSLWPASTAARILLRNPGHREAMTVAQLCDEYIKAAEEGSLITRRGSTKKASTLYTDKGRIERHIKRRLGKRPVKDVTTADIEKFQRDVIIGKTAIDQKTSPAVAPSSPVVAALHRGRLACWAEYSPLPSTKIWADNPVRGVADRREGRQTKGDRQSGSLSGARKSACRRGCEVRRR